MSSTPPSLDRDDGSAASYEAMFRRHYPRAVALGIALSRDVESGHDLAQETMLRAYKRWDEISGHEFVWAWLRRVLTNLVVDRWRSSTTELRAARRSAQWADVESCPEVSTWNELVADLPHRQRIVVTLYYADDRSIAEIADLMGITDGSVKSALSKARERLRITMETETER